MNYFQLNLLEQESIAKSDIVFDLDGTLIEGDIGETLFFHTLLTDHCEPIESASHTQEDHQTFHLSAKKSDAIITYLQWIAEHSFDKAYIHTAKWLEEYNKESITKYLKALLQQNNPPQRINIVATKENSDFHYQISYGARIKKEMLDLVNFFINNQANVWLVSASPQDICDSVAEIFHINAKKVLGVKTNASKDGTVRIPWGPSKVQALQSVGVFTPLLVFGDSEGDLDMLSLARFPVVMESGSAALIQKAKQMNWWLYPNHS